MEPRKIFNDKSEIPVKQVNETPEKQLTIIVNPKTSAENAENLHKLNENKEKKLAENNKSQAPKRMAHCVKLLDENFDFNTSALEYLTDSSTHYLVVAVIGMQGVGKSMILNLIAQSKPIPNLGEKIVQALFEDEKRESNLPDDEYESDELNHVVKSDIDNGADFFKFKIQTFRDITSNTTCTQGVDMYITEDRVILLDCQALWSLAGDDTNLNLMSSRNNDPIVGGLQIASYLMSISHVVISVMDWFTDHVLLRYLHTADMLRPSFTPLITQNVEGDEDDTSSTGENHPHLLLICNKCSANQASSETLWELRESFRKLFQKSKLQLSTGMYLRRDTIKNIGRRVENNNEEPTDKPINMFMLPEILDSTHGTRKYYNDYTFDQLASRLRECVMSASRHPISGVTNLSERGWLHFANKAWETIKKSTFFMEYESILP